MRKTNDEHVQENCDPIVIYKYGPAGAISLCDIYSGHYGDIFPLALDGKLAVSWKGYVAQGTVIFEAFDSANVSIEDMLLWTGTQPFTVKGRYRDSVARYSRLYIISNRPLSHHFRDVQRNDLEKWDTFVGRITQVHHHKEDGTVEILPPWKALEWESLAIPTPTL